MYIMAISCFVALQLWQFTNDAKGESSSELHAQVINLIGLKPEDISAPKKDTDFRTKNLVVLPNTTVAIQIGATPKHYHAKTNEIQFVIEGTGTEYLDGKVVQLKAGDLLIIPKGVSHGELTSGVKVLAIKTPPQSPDDTHVL